MCLFLFFKSVVKTQFEIVDRSLCSSVLKGMTNIACCMFLTSFFAFFVLGALFYIEIRIGGVGASSRQFESGSLGGSDENGSRRNGIEMGAPLSTRVATAVETVNPIAMRGVAEPIGNGKAHSPSPQEAEDAKAEAVAEAAVQMEAEEHTPQGEESNVQVEVTEALPQGGTEATVVASPKEPKEEKTGIHKKRNKIKMAIKELSADS